MKSIRNLLPFVAILAAVAVCAGCSGGEEDLKSRTLPATTNGPKMSTDTMGGGGQKQPKSNGFAGDTSIQQPQ